VGEYMQGHNMPHSLCRFYGLTL